MAADPNDTTPASVPPVPEFSALTVDDHVDALRDAVSDVESTREALAEAMDDYQSAIAALRDTATEAATDYPDEFTGLADAAAIMADEADRLEEPSDGGIPEELAHVRRVVWAAHREEEGETEESEVLDLDADEEAPVTENDQPTSETGEEGAP